MRNTLASRNHSIHKRDARLHEEPDPEDPLLLTSPSLSSAVSVHSLLGRVHLSWVSTLLATRAASWSVIQTS